MARVEDLRLRDRWFVRTYRWRRNDPVPWAPRSRPLSKCSVAIVTTGGFVAPGQPPFDEGVKGGDFSYRVIPGDQDVRELGEHHASEAFDHEGIERDANLGFPLDRLRELARDGTVGAVAPRHLSFMGSITAPGRLTARTAPEAAGLLVEDGVDVALLVPV